MDKKQLIWIMIIAAAVALLLPRLMQKSTGPAPATQPTAVQAPVSPRWNYGGAALSQTDLEKNAIPRVLLGSLLPEDGYNFRAQIDPRGASLYTVKLTGYYMTVEQKRVKNKTPQQLEEWSYPLLNPVSGGPEEFLSYSTERLRVGDANAEEISTFQSPVTMVRPAAPGGAEGPAVPGRIGWYQVGEKKVAPDGTESVTFALDLFPSQQAAEPSYRLTKTYRLTKGSYNLRMSLKVENLSGQSQKLSVLQNGPGGLPREDISQQDFRGVLSGRYVAAEGKITVPRLFLRDEVRAKVQAKKEGWAIGHRERLGDNRDNNAQRIVWAGQINKFFGSMMYPLPGALTTQPVEPNTAVSALIVPETQCPYDFDLLVAREDANSVVPVVVFDGKAVDVPDKKALELEYDIYCGPKDRELFGRIPLYQKLNYQETIQFQSCQWSWCLAMVKPLALGVMWSLEEGGKLVGNYGVVIIVLVLVIRVLLHPITKRSQISMMRMQKLGPKMKEIQEKYKDDKPAQQKAMGEVFRQTGVTPILGCLPMLLQTPIWMALWAGLSASVSLRQEGLLPFWITDLSAPDTVIGWTPFSLPLIGTTIAGLNILPILLMVFMFFQQKLTPMQSAPTTSPDQQRQQKMMMYMMSAMMLLIFYNAPSGLTLYIMASTAAGVFESQVIRKHIREREAAEAAAETKVSMPGWTPRGKRPKKPKGPFGA